MANPELLSFLKNKLEQVESITFKDFMEDALYHPNWGYYNSSIKKLGKEGDFYTSVHVGSIFGKTLAKQLIEMADYLGWDELVLLEFGGGEGYLAKDILDALWELRPKETQKLKYYLSERSSHHRKKQQSILKDYLSQIYWIDELAEINEGKSFKGIVFSNELIDAFPVHRVKMVDGELKEIFIKYDGQFFETLGSLSHPSLEKYFNNLNFELEEGQEAEINLDAIHWLESLGKYLAKGFVITIDYGYLMPELKMPHRRAGTIMCYHQHQADDKPLEQVGLKDITSHVNFTALIEYGKRAGLEPVGFTNQMKFLVGLGIGEVMEQPGLSELEIQKLSLSLKELLMPEKMGERFKVLIQQKGVTDSPKLSGLKGFT